MLEVEVLEVARLRLYCGEQIGGGVVFEADAEDASVWECDDSVSEIGHAVIVAWWRALSFGYRLWGERAVDDRHGALNARSW